MWLIGRKWKYSDVWSGPVLIDRGLDLSREAVLKERKRRIKLTESLTPKQGFGVGKGIWKQIIPRLEAEGNWS